MGQGASAVEGEEDGEDGEGTEPASCCSSCTELEQELAAARADLTKKEEQVEKLSKIRDEVEAELEELTASLFQVGLEGDCLRIWTLSLSLVSCLVSALVKFRSRVSVSVWRAVRSIAAVCRRLTAWWPRRWPSARGRRRRSLSPT